MLLHPPVAGDCQFPGSTPSECRGFILFVLTGAIDVIHPDRYFGRCCSILCTRWSVSSVSHFQHSAHNVGIFNVPGIVTDASILAIVKNLKTSSKNKAVNKKVVEIYLFPPNI